MYHNSLINMYTYILFNVIFMYFMYLSRGLCINPPSPPLSPLGLQWGVCMVLQWLIFSREI